MAEENPNGGKPGADNVTFEAWLEGQSDEVKNRFAEGTTGLKSALTSERENSKTLSGQLKELQGKVAEGSEAAKQIAQLQAQIADKDKRIAESERREAFSAGAKKAGCSNSKAAYAIAVSGDLFKKNGDPDWDAIKAEAPELFGKKNPDGNAGNGTGGDPDAGKGNYMDNLIRKQLHRN